MTVLIKPDKKLGLLLISVDHDSAKIYQKPGNWTILACTGFKNTLA